MNTDTFTPTGIHFFSRARGKNMILVTEGDWKDWLVFKHPDGQWVSLRKATDRDRQDLEQAPRFGLV